MGILDRSDERRKKKKEKDQDTRKVTIREIGDQRPEEK
jgi:hypothetical protein